MARKAKPAERSHAENAVRFGMEVYGYLHDRFYDAKRYREHCQCGSPEHTSLQAAIDQCVGIMSNWVFTVSGHNYELVERMRDEAESICPDFAGLAGKWGKGELK